MEVKIIDAVKTAKTTAKAAKGAEKGKFDKVLENAENNFNSDSGIDVKKDTEKDIEKDENSVLPQLLAAYVLTTPLQQMPDGKEILTGGSENASEAAGNTAVNVSEEVESLSQMPPQKLLITNAAVPNVPPNVSTQEEIQQDTAFEQNFAASVPDSEAQAAAASIADAEAHTITASVSDTKAQTAAQQISDMQSSNVNTADIKAPDLTAYKADTPLTTAQNQDMQVQVIASENTAAQTVGNTTAATETTVNSKQSDSTAVKNSAETDTAIQSAVQTEKTEPAAKQTENLSQSDTGDSGQDSDRNDVLSGQVFNIQQSDSVYADNTKVSEPEKTDVANQLADTVKQAVDSGRTEVKMHLSPEELGGISIKIVSQGGTLSLQIVADSQRTSELLASNMHNLTQAMQDKGITMSHTEVTYAGMGGFDAAASQQQNQQSFGGMTPRWASSPHTSPIFGVSGVSETEEPAVEPEPEISGLSILA